MKSPNVLRGKLAISATLFFCLSASAITNDLVITSITRENNCTTLIWNSHPGAFYTVQWTDSLSPPIYWRIAEVNVPSQGTNTIWSEDGCSQMLMAGGGSESTSEPAEPKDTEPADEKPTVPMVAPNDGTTQPLPLAIYPPGIDLTGYIIFWPDGSTEEWSKEVVEKWRESQWQNGAEMDGEDDEVPVEARFYRVVRTAVMGTVDGWSSTPMEIPTGLTNVFGISCGFAHNLALRSNGTVIAWGTNQYGQCNVPTNLTDVVAVAAGAYHSTAVQRDGSVLVWGDNTYGQVTNQPANLTNIVDVKAGYYHTLALKSDGTLAAWGGGYLTNAVPPDVSNVTAIAAFGYHCLALKRDGTVAAWGFSPFPFIDFMPTNLPSSWSNIVGIAAGRYHNLGLRNDGTVIGYGFPPGVSVPAGLSNVVAVGAGYDSGLAIKQDTTLSVWGQALSYQGLSNVVAVSGGTLRWLCILANTDNVVIRQQPQSMSVPLGWNTNLNVVATGAAPLAYQWQKQDGTNWVDLGGATNSALVFTNFQDTNDGVYRVRVSNAVNSLTSSNATLIAMYPPVITNQTPDLDICTPQQTSLTEAIVTLTVGASAKGSTSLGYTWYHDSSVISGNQYFKPVHCRSLADEGFYRVVVSNLAGSATSAWWRITIRLQGEATAWGDNTYGQTNRFPSETNFVAIAAGGYHTTGLRENGSVFGWGDNGYGQTDAPANATNVAAIAAGQWHNLALTESGSVVAWGDNTYAQCNVPTDLTNAVAVAAGGFHSLGLRGNGSITAWGTGSASVVPAGLSNVIAVAAGYGHSLAALTNGTVVCWGDNTYGQTNPPAGLTNAVAVAAGVYHSLALKADGTVIGWGANGSGEADVPVALTNAMRIGAGYGYSLALCNDGRVVVWGALSNAPGGLQETWAVSAGYYHAAALAYSLTLNYPVTVSQDLLLICNTNSQDSTDVLNYYLANRPLVQDANVLGLDCPVGEFFANRGELTNRFLAPVQAWRSANPTKRPRYIVLFLDVPSRISDGGVSASSSVSLYNLYGPCKPFITHLNMGTLTDCVAYVDKLTAYGQAFSPGQVVIRATRGGYTNSLWYFDDAQRIYPAAHPAQEARDGLLAVGVPSSAVTIQEGSVHITQATNVAGYMTWGANGGQGGNYANNGSVIFSGDSGWYIIQTKESFNGQRVTSQGNFIDWFASSAFGSADYEFTPVGAVTHVEEPQYVGTSDPAKYFGMWALGKYFSICAWNSRNTPYFQAVGDPLVTK